MRKKLKKDPMDDGEFDRMFRALKGSKDPGQLLKCAGVLQVLRVGLTQRDAARVMHVSEGSIHGWLEDYIEGGRDPAALGSEPRGRPVLFRDEDWIPRLRVILERAGSDGAALTLSGVREKLIEYMKEEQKREGEGRGGPGEGRGEVPKEATLRKILKERKLGARYRKETGWSLVPVDEDSDKKGRV